jgi:hypothetical protein
MTTLMRTVETVDWEDPRHVPCETRTRAFGWDPIRGLHQGQQPQRLHRKAVYMAAPDPLVEMPDFPLAPRAPSIHGTRRTSRDVRLMVAMGCKADVESPVLCLPQSDYMPVSFHVGCGRLARLRPKPLKESFKKIDLFWRIGQMYRICLGDGLRGWQRLVD